MLDPTDETKVFHAYLRHGKYILAREFHGPEKGGLANDPIFEMSNIYFICQMTRLRFMHRDIQVGTDNVAHIPLKIGNSRTTTFHIGDFGVQRQDKPIHRVRLVRDRRDSEQVVSQATSCSSPEPVVAAGIDWDGTTEHTLMLRIFDPEGDYTLSFSPYYLCDATGTPIFDFSNIVYIGKTQALGGVNERLSEHENLGKALSQCPDDLDIYLYFFLFESQPITFGTADFRFLTDIAPQVRIIEMCLINYFKPLYNVNYAWCDIAEKKEVVDSLVKRGYSHIGVDVAFTGNEHHESLGQWCFGSRYQPPAKVHMASFDLRSTPGDVHA